MSIRLHSAARESHANVVRTSGLVVDPAHAAANKVATCANDQGTFKWATFEELGGEPLPTTGQVPSVGPAGEVVWITPSAGAHTHSTLVTPDTQVTTVQVLNSVGQNGRVLVGQSQALPGQLDFIGSGFGVSETSLRYDGVVGGKFLIRHNNPAPIAIHGTFLGSSIEFALATTVSQLAVPLMNFQRNAATTAAGCTLFHDATGNPGTDGQILTQVTGGPDPGPQWVTPVGNNQLTAQFLAKSFSADGDNLIIAAPVTAAVTQSPLHYTRSGNIVTIYGTLVYDTTTANPILTISSLQLKLPVPASLSLTGSNPSQQYQFNDGAGGLTIPKDASVSFSIPTGTHIQFVQDFTNGVYTQVNAQKSMSFRITYVSTTSL